MLLLTKKKSENIKQDVVEEPKENTLKNDSKSSEDNLFLVTRVIDGDTIEIEGG